MDPKKSLKNKRTFGIIVTILGILAFFVNRLIGVIFIGIGVWFARSIKPEERMATDTRMKKIALPYPMTVQEILEKIEGCYFVTGAPYICRTSFVDYTDCIVWGPHWQYKFLYGFVSPDGKEFCISWSNQVDRPVTPFEPFRTKKLALPRNKKLHEEFDADAYIREIAPIIYRAINSGQ